MRTTLSIDDDVLAAAKGLAKREHRSIGEIISDLARRGLRPPTSGTPAKIRNGIPLLPVRPDSMPVTSEIVAALDDESP